MLVEGDPRRLGRYGHSPIVAGRQATLRDVALPLAEHRDALAAEVARLREVIATKYAIERSSLGVSALVEERATIAIAAGLGADATAEEVAARVGEMRGALVEMHLASLDIEGLSPTESSTRWSRMIDADDAIDNLARRLAEEAGRDEDAAPAIVQPVGGCDGSREFAYDGSAEDGRGLRLARRCPGCRACS